MKLTLELYRCSECGNVREIPRNAGKKRQAHHPKHMYCTQCAKSTKFIKSDQ